MALDLAEYRALVAKVDAFFDRVHGRYGGQMQCAAGCSACCEVSLTLSPVEAAELGQHVASLPEAERTRLATRARAPQPDRCAALEDDGRCAVYAARPLVCRTHGVPMRLPGHPSLKVVEEREGLAVCSLNFVGVALTAVDPDCVLALESIDALLAVVNARASQAQGQDRLARVALSDVLSAAHLP